MKTQFINFHFFLELHHMPPSDYNRIGGPSTHKLFRDTDSYKSVYYLTNKAFSPMDSFYKYYFKARPFWTKADASII
jgi:hypothetical protein